MLTAAPCSRPAAVSPFLSPPRATRSTRPWGLGTPHAGRRVRRGRLAPSAGVRARVASRLALPRRHASSCPCAAVLSRQPIGRYDRVESVGSLRARCACSLPVLWRRVGICGATRVTARGRSFRGRFASCCCDAVAPIAWLCGRQSVLCVEATVLAPSHGVLGSAPSRNRGGRPLALWCRREVRLDEPLGDGGSGSAAARRGGPSRRWRGRSCEAQLTARGPHRAR